MPTKFFFGRAFILRLKSRTWATNESQNFSAQHGTSWKKRLPPTLIQTTCQNHGFCCVGERVENVRVATADCSRRRSAGAPRGSARIAKGDFRQVNNKVLLTGHPGCGKTTLIRRVVNELGQGAGGFYTEEIRERRERVGFKIVTLNGEEGVFAHVNFKTQQRLGKYGLDLSTLETIGIEAVREALRRRQLTVIDEIGPMEIRSAIFRDVVTEALNSRAPLLGTITARPFPFTNAIKKRRGVTLTEVRGDNREQLVSELSEHFTA